MTTFDETAVVQTTLTSSETSTAPSAKTETAEAAASNPDTTLSNILTEANLENLEQIVDGVLSETSIAERSVWQLNGSILFDQENKMGGVRAYGSRWLPLPICRSNSNFKILDHMFSSSRSSI